MESCWSYPDSEEYKRSKEAKALCFELVKTVQSNHLDEEIQAMVADVKSGQQKQVYYSKGKIRSDQEVMTEPIAAEFDVISRIKKTLVDDYNISSRISDVMQKQKLEEINAELKYQEKEKANKIANNFSVVLDDIREQCEEQLWETIQDIAIEHENDNNRIIQDMKNKLESELVPLEESYQEVQASFDQISLEHEKVKFAALQSYTILKKYNLLPENMRFTFTKEDEANLMEILNEYKKAINEKDEAILNLKRQIAKLDYRSEPHSSPKRNSITGRPSMIGRSSISSNERQSFLHKPSMAEYTSGEDGDDFQVLDAPPVPHEPDFSEADILEKKYIQELQSLRELHEKVLLGLQEKRNKQKKQWDIKSHSISNLRINSKLQKIVKRQNLLLNLATKSRPQPDCHKEVTAHLSGISLRQMNIFQLKTVISNIPTSIEAQASVNDALQYTFSNANLDDDNDYLPPQRDFLSISVSKGFSGLKKTPDKTLRRRSSSFGPKIDQESSLQKLAKSSSFNLDKHPQ